MKINFTKYNGAGNDFILIDSENFPASPALIQKLCDRHFGIGADGLLWIKKSDIADFSVRYFNSDGTGDTLCINGARCAVMYAYINKYCFKRCRFEFIGRIFSAQILDEKNVKLFLDYSPSIELSKRIVFLSKELEYSYVDLGSKHIVIDWEFFSKIFVAELNNKGFNEFDIEYFGKGLRYHDAFYPDGVNVNFIQINSLNQIVIRTFERGVEAETLACGSGSIASVISASLKSNLKLPASVKTKSGRFLEVYFEIIEKRVTNIFIIGPAEYVFKGELDL